MGKPATLADGHFVGHDAVGAELAAAWLDGLRAPRAFTVRVAHLIRHHMFAYSADWSDAAVRRFIRRIGQTDFEDLLDLRAADNVGSGLAADVDGLDELRARCRAQLAAHVALSRGDLAVDGDDLMRALSLAPGPVVGRLLDELLERVLADPMLNERRPAPRDSPGAGRPAGADAGRRRRDRAPPRRRERARARAPGFGRGNLPLRARRRPPQRDRGRRPLARCARARRRCRCPGAGPGGARDRPRERDGASHGRSPGRGCALPGHGPRGRASAGRAHPPGLPTRPDARQPCRPRLQPLRLSPPPPADPATPVTPAAPALPAPPARPGLLRRILRRS